MKPRTLAVIFAVFVVVTVLYVVMVTRPGLDGGGGDERADQTRTLESLAGGPVESIRVSSAAGGYTLTLSATGDGSGSASREGWTVDGAPVAREMAGRLDDAIKGTVIGEAVPTRNRANQAAFGIGGPTAVTADITGARELTFSFGNPALDPREYFVRIDGSDEVRTVQGDLRTLLAGAEDDWRQKVVTRADPGAIQEVELTTPRGRVVVRQNRGIWVIDSADGGKARANRAAAESLLGALSSLESTEFVSASKLARPFGRVDLTVETRAKGSVLDRIELHRRPDGRYVARKTAGEGRGERWLLSDDSVGALTHPSFGLK